VRSAEKLGAKPTVVGMDAEPQDCVAFATLPSAYQWLKIQGGSVLAWLLYNAIIAVLD
jgi:hypothetical protein